MPDRVQDLKNHRQVAVACKNYTDSEIKKSEGRILSIVARNNVSYIDHTDEATYRFTAPANAKLLMLQSVGGNSVKYSPSVASDNNATHIKTLPSTVYDLDVSKVDGVGYKVNQLVKDTFHNYSYSLGQWGSNFLTDVNIIENHKYLLVYKVSSLTSGNLKICFGNLSSQPNAFTKTIDENTTLNTAISSVFTANSAIAGYKASIYNLYTTSAVGTIDFVNIFDLTADFGSGNEPTSVSDCYTAYLQRGINIYEYTPQQSSIKNNAFTGATVEGANLCEIADKASTTTSGITYKVENGVITLNGTATETAWVSLTLEQALPKGNYVFNAFNPTTNNSVLTWFRNINNEDYSYKYLTEVNSVTTITDNSIKVFRFNITSGTTLNNFKIIPMIVRGSTAPSNYQPYVAPTTISVDLTQIKDSNNNSLFPSGKLMGNSSVADFITPYNQESRWNEYTFTGNESVSARTVAEGYNGYTINEVLDYKVHTTNFVSNLGLESRTNVYSISGIELDTNKMYITFPTSQGIDTTAKCIAFLTGKTMQYERATYLTSNTDLTSLTGIQGQSLGTITLNNTGNVDMPNLISYNAIIKHALATAVKQEGANRFNINEVYSNTSNFTINGDIVTGIAPYVFTPTYSKRNFTQDEIGNTFKFRVLFTSNCRGSNLRVVKRENGITSDGNLVSTFPNYSTITVTPTSVDDYIGINFSSATSIQISEVMLNEGSTVLSYRPYKAPITRLLPNSEAKYSWGITDGVRNTRVFCDDEGNAVNDGSLVVGNQDLSELDYSLYNADYGAFYSADLINLIAGNTNNLIANFKIESSLWFFNHSSDNQKAIHIYTNKYLYIRDNILWINKTSAIVKSSLSGELLFYEKNTIDTETLDDFDYFFDCEEGDTFTLVNTEQLQCYATYSFLIKEAKSNE